MALEALASRYSVSLLIVELYPSLDQNAGKYFDRICRRWTAVELTPSPPRRFWRRRQSFSEVLFEYKKLHFEVIHVFRLAMLPFAEPFLQAFPNARRHLDLDDIDSATHDRIAELADSNGDHDLASREREAADRSRLMEQQACSRFHRVYVCSQSDEDRLSKLQSGTDIEILPNAVRMSERPLRSGSRVMSLLFAGTLGYYPNEDAAVYLCREVVSRLRQRTGRSVEVKIVGSGASLRLRQAAAEAGADVPGFVGAIRDSYERASMVVVPLRAAGGTRIKILEAWSYGRPVVASSIGIEGLAARNGEHALIADDADSFADCCLRLMQDADLCKRLIGNGQSLVAELYSPDSLRRTIAALDD
jgi:glycosyltransferase involved in cell wall biosynthesis